MELVNKDIKLLRLNREYSITGNSHNIILNKDGSINLEIRTLSSIRNLSNLDSIKSIIDYYPELSILNTSGSLDFKTLLGNKKSKEYSFYLKQKIQESLNLITDYHTKIFPLRRECYNNLSKVMLEGKVLDTPVYNHAGVTGRTSITKGFNFLTLKKDKRKQILPVDKNKCLVEVDFKSCEPFFYLKSNNFDIDSDDVYLWLCDKYDIEIKNRDYVKRGILSMIYGANENTISKVMKISKGKVLEMKHALGLDSLKENLQNDYDSKGFFLNYYGRPITNDNNLVNYYIQSSAVDFCSLAFISFCKRNNVRPSYFIHDSMTFQCDKSKLQDILKIKSITEEYSNITIPVEFNVLYE
jgi:hypothetical protein